MKALQRKFILQLFFISLLIYGILYVFFSKVVAAELPLLVMVALLFVINSLAYILITNTKEKKPRNFVYSYMTISFGRLLVCSAFVFSYGLTHRHDAKIFAITFFLQYFTYTIVEVRAIYAFFGKRN